MAIRYNTGSTPNTSWTNFTSDGTATSDEIYVRTSTATGAFSTSSDQKVSKVYYHNGSVWVEVFANVATPPTPPTPTLSQVTGFNFGSIWNERVDQVNMIWSAVTNATSYVLTATNVNDPYNDVKTATLTSSTTSSKNLTVTNLTPGQTYDLNVVAKASGYLDSPASATKRIQMGVKAVNFNDLNITPGYTRANGVSWIFANSSNTANCNIGNTFVGTVAAKSSDNFVGYRQVTRVKTYFKRYSSLILETNGTNFDTVIKSGSSTSGAVTYPLDPNNWVEAVYSTSPGSTSGDFGVFVSGTGLATRKSTSCALNSEYSFYGTEVLISGTETTSNSQIQI